MIKFDYAKQKMMRKKGNSVAGVFIRNGMLYVRKKIGGKLYPYSTGKKANDANKQWVEYHAESIWEEKHNNREVEVTHSEPTVEEFGLKYYSLCPDTREEDTNKRLLHDFKTYCAPLLGHYKLSEVTATIIAQWQEKIKYYPDEIPEADKIDKIKPKRAFSRVKNIKNSLSLVFNQAVEDGLIPSSPVKSVKLVKKATKRCSLSIEEAESFDESEIEDIFSDNTVVYSEKEIELLIQMCDVIIASIKSSHHRFAWKSFKWLMIFKFYSGVRSGEAIALMWKYVDFENNKIDIRFTMQSGGKMKLPKENKTRTIDMLPQAKMALLEIQKLSGHTKWVFLNSKREPYRYVDGVNKLWKQVVEKANLQPARFYNTRHSFVTNMLSRGMNSEWLIQQVGHASLVITRKHYEGVIEPEWDRLTNNLEI
jgi:integrase